eukprot:scaffold2639_cov95-Isochrysis_galbana.AAC.5
MAPRPPCYICPPQPQRQLSTFTHTFASTAFSLPPPAPAPAPVGSPPRPPLGTSLRLTAG